MPAINILRGDVYLCQFRDRVLSEDKVVKGIRITCCGSRAKRGDGACPFASVHPRRWVTCNGRLDSCGTGDRSRIDTVKLRMQVMLWLFERLSTHQSNRHLSNLLLTETLLPLCSWPRNWRFVLMIVGLPQLDHFLGRNCRWGGEWILRVNPRVAQARS